MGLILKVVATGDSSRHKSEHGHHKAYFGKSRPYRFKIKITQILAKEPFKKTYLKMGMLSVTTRRRSKSRSIMKTCEHLCPAHSTTPAERAQLKISTLTAELSSQTNWITLFASGLLTRRAG